MKFIRHTKIEGLITIEPKCFEDERGLFFEYYNKNVFHDYGISDNFVQDNQSISKKNVLRGLHYQKAPFEQSKLVRAIKGKVLDIAVDIRKNSKTYGKYLSVILSSENKKMFYIPAGFAHGFLALEDDTILNYKCSNFYSPQHEGSLLWSDKTINIDWGTNYSNQLIISEKDNQAPLLQSI